MVLSLSGGKKPRCIYSVGYSQEHDAENFYREMLMLYVPWRNENSIIGSHLSYEDKYNEMRDSIEEKRKQYVSDFAVDISQLAQEFLNSESEYHDPIVSVM